MPVKQELVEKIKQELKKEDEPKQKSRISWGSGLVTACLVVLSVVSISQTVQSATILEKLENNNFGPSKSSSSALPANLENLPNMVGGC